MPIKPENKARYPKDWEQIRQAILARAGDICECRGECGIRHALSDGAGLRCGAPNRQFVKWVDGGKNWRFVELGASGVRIILTIAHLDHTPEHNDPSNLKAMCQLCHNNYDREHRQANAKRTREEKKAQQFATIGQLKVALD